MTAELSQSPVRFIILNREKTKIRTDVFPTTRSNRRVAVSFSVTLRDSVNHNNWEARVLYFVLLTGQWPM